MIAGDPEVGKSTLLNAFVNEQISSISTQFQDIYYKTMKLADGTSLNLELWDLPSS